MKLRRCPACRLAGRERLSVIVHTYRMMGEDISEAQCASCGTRGPRCGSRDDAAMTWNALSRAAKRGMKRAQQEDRPCES